ncbi:MAG: hypothetical protein MUF84_14925 [Anaerolineae bacterium]|nr:hypothetical protein [Anaerolineae bacterium]
MSIVAKIRDALFGSASAEIRDPTGIYVYVRCDRCGAPVRVRIDRVYDLQHDHETGEFVVHKEIMDGTCFALMQAHIRLSPRYAIISGEVTGGKLISWKEYNALAKRSATKA